MSQARKQALISGAAWLVIGVAFGQKARQSQVGNFDVPFVRNEDVARFDVTVNQPLGMGGRQVRTEPEFGMPLDLFKRDLKGVDKRWVERQPADTAPPTVQWDHRVVLIYSRTLSD